VYLHRKVTHGALALHPAIEAVCKFWNWTTSGIVPLQWAAVHRKHHQFTDQEGDPHSPHLLGLWKVFFWNVALYRKEAKNPETLRVFIHQKEWDSRSWFDTHIFSRGLVGLAIGIATLCGLLGIVPGLIASATHAILYMLVLSPAVNSICHSKFWIGYQRYKRGNHVKHAYNNLPVALFTCGEGNHNNHHEAPKAAKLSRKWWEPDPGWYAIWLLKIFKLATVNHMPTNNESH
jgi:stearoyl-CoA desaturase (delta-9 desaturase)